MIPSNDKIYKTIEQLWNADTLPADIAVHLCFMVVSSFAFFFVDSTIVLLMESVIFTDSSISIANYLIGWSNILLNLLFMLIIINSSQNIAKAYWRYRRDNL
jgi:hypothetical protein